MTLENLTILIQGRCSDECLNLQNKNYYNYNVIYSLWNDSSVEISEHDSVKVIKSTKPKESGPQNLFLQVVSTLNGLLQVKTKYCIKMRADEYVSNIDYILTSINEYPEQLHTLPVYFRAYDKIPFHCSDHLIAGTTENLITMFKSCHDKIIKNNWDSKYFFTAPEVELTKSYLQQREQCNIESQRHLMAKYFKILDIDKLKPYIISSNKVGKKFHSDFDSKANDSIVDLTNY